MALRPDYDGWAALALSVAIHAAGIPVGCWGVRIALTSTREGLTVSGITVTMVEARASSAVIVEAARLMEERLPVPEGKLAPKDFVAGALRTAPDAGMTSGRVLDAGIPLPGDAGERTDRDTKGWGDAPLLVPDAPVGSSEVGLFVPLGKGVAGASGPSSGGVGASGPSSGGAGVSGPSSGGAGLSGSSDAHDMVFAADIRPRYPVGARMRGEQGSVTVQVEVDGGGQVTAAVVLQSSSYPVLDRAALDAVHRAQFVSRRNGKPSGGTVVLTFRFQLTE